MSEMLNKDNKSRYFEFVKVSFFLMYKRMIEYKANFWSSIFTQFSFFCVMSCFFVFFSDNFGDVVGWTKWDFFLFVVVSDTIVCFAGIFYWDRILFKYIKDGMLNQMLFQPIKPFFNFVFKDLVSGGLLMVLINLPILIFLLVYLNIKLYLIFVCLCISVLIVLLYVFCYFFLESFNFYKLGTSNVTRPVFFEVNEVLVTYTFQFFEKAWFKYFLFAWGHVFSGSLIIPILRGYEVWNFWLQICILIGLVLFFLFGTLFNWHYGLKRYEAFG